MAKIRRFEEIEAWQNARELTRAIYACARTGNFSRDFGLRDQICRASVSIMSNIAEGFERGGNAEFRQFLAVAKGSVAEVEAQLYVARDQEYITQAQFETMQALAQSTKRQIAGFMNYLSKTTLRGQKFK
ncbi:MAG: four helix bundle protein [SAR324 cluster bacterium]|nr:four helix bundle protein [SAR324 cluster bacterium]